MCSMYWNLKATVTCPACQVKAEWGLQTHFMGEAGSCVNFYKVGDTLPELEGASGSVAPADDEPLFGYCPKCEAPADWGFHFSGGAVTVVGPEVQVWKVPA